MKKCFIFRYDIYFSCRVFKKKTYYISEINLIKSFKKMKTNKYLNSYVNYQCRKSTHVSRQEGTFIPKKFLNFQ